MKMEKIKWIVLIVMLLTYTISHSVPVEKELPKPLSDDDQAPENPIDGGLSFLLIAGAAYGVYKLKEK